MANNRVDGCETRAEEESRGLSSEAELDGDGATHMDLGPLLQELRARERSAVALRAGPSNPGAGPNVEAFADVPTQHLVEAVRAGQRAIYGTDNRIEIFDVIDQQIRNNADSVAALFRAGEIMDNGNNTATLLTSNFGQHYNLCSSERFGAQPIGAICTGFLVGSDLIATAGHCVDENNVTHIRFVFGYRMIDETNAKTTIDIKDIYAGTRIVGRVFERTADWALVQVDRAVRDRAILSIRRKGAIKAQQAVYVIGHPVGLPAKFSGDATVRDNTAAAFFVANLDTFAVNSGSPVFNADDHVVEGVLVRGETDFVQNGGCCVSLVCPTTGCRGEECTRTTEFSGLVP